MLPATQSHCGGVQVVLLQLLRASVAVLPFQGKETFVREEQEVA